MTIMPYASGTWGPEAQERSKKRLAFFHLRYLRNRRKILKDYHNNVNGKKDRQKQLDKEFYERHKEDIKLRSIEYYYSHRDEIIKRNREKREKTRKQKTTYRKRNISLIRNTVYKDTFPMKNRESK